MTDGREQERLRAALREAAEHGGRGIDVGSVLEASRRRRRPRVAIAGGALAVLLIASGVGLAGGLLPQVAMTGASDSAEDASAPSSDDGADDGAASEGTGQAESSDEPTASSGQDAVPESAGVCATPAGVLAAERGVAITTPAVLDRDGTTAIMVGGLGAPLAGEVLVESIALLDDERVVAVLLGADGAAEVDVAAGATTLLEVQGALIACGDSLPEPGGYDAVATVLVIDESGSAGTLQSAPSPITLR